MFEQTTGGPFGLELQETVGESPTLVKRVGEDCGGVWMSGNRVGLGA